MKKTTVIIGLCSALMCAAAFAADLPQAPEGQPPHSEGFEHKSVTRAEFTKHAEERFTKMDANGDGVLSPEERKAGHEKMREKRQERREHRGERSRGEQPPPAQ